MRIDTDGWKRMAVIAAISTCAGLTQAASVPTDGLTFYAPLDGSYEAQAGEGSVTPNKNQSTQFVEGRFGEAVELAGEGRLYYPGTGTFNLSEGTVTMWANRNKAWKQAGEGYILMKAVAGPGWNKNSLYFMVTAHNQIRVWVWSNDQKQTLYMISPVPEQANEWVHLAFSYTDGEVRIYVNGEEGSYTGDGRGDPMMVMPSGNVKYLQIGSDYNHAFEGAIDEVRVYNRVLSPEEIKAVYTYTP